ncbi:MAG: hypothetical protein ACM3KR_09710 [Deltaproteobacteria bacterium]
MYSIGLFFIQILIIALFVILFLLIKYNKISTGSALALLVLSITAFVFLPNIILKWGFVRALIILILFVLFGMELVIMLEERDLSKLKIENISGIFNFQELIKRFNLSQRFKFIEKIISFKKVEELAEKKENVLITEPQEKIIPVEQDVVDFLTSNENISYVDFEKKDEQYGDIFSKFIRGEIPASEVRERISKKETGAAREEIPKPDHKIRSKNEVKKAPKKQKKEHKEGVNHVLNSEGSEIQMTVEKFIDSAFAAKTEGKYLEAIEYYIQALEKKPEEQLILWIIIDVCSLYRELGQEDIAKEMIKSYIETAGNSISQEVIDDLKKNFGI